MWRPEDDIRFLSYQLAPGGRLSELKPEPADMATLASHFASGSPVSLPAAGFTGGPAHLPHI